MLSRRRFNRHLVTSAMAMTGTALVGCGGSASAQTQPAASPDTTGWVMPDEADAHQRTWMAFGASRAIWGDELLPVVRGNLGLIASTIAAFEPVTVLARSAELDLARRHCGPKVQLLACPLDDAWVRDSGPVFVKGPAGERGAIDFNFNGWGRRQAHQLDKAVARRVAAAAGARAVAAPLALEGGGIEVDGQGTAIVTESCVLNDNRNPGVSKATAEAHLRALLGVRKVIWLPGIRGRDITDGHTDFYARFTEPGVVVAHLDTDPSSYDHAVTLRHLDILRATTDAAGKRLEVVVLEAPTQVRPQFESDSFAAGYVNFYVCNGAVIVPQFGDATADGNAAQALRELFPGREVVPLNVDGVAAGGGGIHCMTQQEPAP